ncbi:MAG TPA: hypothetical protein DD401_02255 [Prevotella sp.]|nr:hypothetical protein [Prevotella sp.]
MKRYAPITILLALLLLTAAPARAQRHTRTTQRATQHLQATTGKAMQLYADSLRLYADSLYADSVSVPPTLSATDAAPMFLPMTFYKGVAQKAFAIGDSLTAIDDHLLHIYLTRPDLVAATEKQLEKAGPVLAPKTVTDRPEVETPQTQPKEVMPDPVDIIVLKPNFWSFSGDHYLQFLQNYVSSNWYRGGQSNYSMVGALTLRANYNNKQKVRWDNTLEMKLGFQTSRGDSLHSLKTSEDLLRYTGKLGLQATKRWYYTFQVVASTQFMRNFGTNSNYVYSDFLSPLNVNVSIGMDYNVDWLKGKLKGSVHLAPLAYNFKFVDRVNLATRYGIEKDHHALNDFGSQVTVDVTWRFSNNISWRSRIYGYTTYERAEMEFENTFSFQFNRYIAAKFFVYPRFDDSRSRDDHHGYWMFKEYTSLGFSYSF